MKTHLYSVQTEVQKQRSNKAFEKRFFKNSETAVRSLSSTYSEKSSIAPPPFNFILSGTLRTVLSTNVIPHQCQHETALTVSLLILSFVNPISLP